MSLSPFSIWYDVQATLVPQAAYFTLRVDKISVYLCTAQYDCVVTLAKLRRKC